MLYACLMAVLNGSGLLFSKQNVQAAMIPHVQVPYDLCPAKQLTAPIPCACALYATSFQSNHRCSIAHAGEDAIKHLLSRGTHREFGYAALVTMLVVYFLGAVWAAGSAIASGLFVPMLLIGSCIGRIVGLICVDIAASGGHGSPG